MDDKIKQFAKSALPLIYLVVALLALRWTVVEPYVVPTGSMEPTLKKGDRLYALKCAYDIRIPFTDITLFRTGKLDRGDVILFRSPEDPSITFVKRAVGLPGDKLEFRSGVLYVNGQEQPQVPAPLRDVMYDIEEQEMKRLLIENLTGLKHWVIFSDFRPIVRDIPEIIVPPDHVFAVGDNRDNSHDSRAWGFVPIKNLKGEAMFIWFSSWDWKIRTERVGTLIQ